MQSLRKRLDDLTDQAILQRLYTGPIFKSLGEECKLALASTLVEWDRFKDISDKVINGHLYPYLAEEGLHLMPKGMMVKPDDYHVNVPVLFLKENPSVGTGIIECVRIEKLPPADIERYCAPYRGYRYTTNDKSRPLYLYLEVTTKQRVEAFLLEHLDNLLQAEIQTQTSNK